MDCLTKTIGLLCLFVLLIRNYNDFVAAEEKRVNGYNWHHKANIKTCPSQCQYMCSMVPNVRLNDNNRCVPKTKNPPLVPSNVIESCECCVKG